MTARPENQPAAPYVGLRPFEFREAPLFYGRGEHISEMVRTLRKKHFLAVIGSSGSGKSSLVRAGLLPAIAAGFMNGGEGDLDWRFVLMRPGLDPYENLLRELLPKLLPDQSLDPELVEFRRQTLRGGPRGLVEAFTDSLLPESTRLVVLVDQFEEIFRFLERNGSRRPDEDQSVADQRNAALAFVDMLLATAAECHPQVYVVLTMRSEYLGECEAFLGLSAAIAKAQFLTPRMTREQIQDIIERPIAAVGGQIAPQVVTTLLNSLGTALDQLPRVEHVLLRMWYDACAARAAAGDLNRPVVLTMESYKAAGRFESALEQHAQHLYQDLGPAPAGPPSEKQRVAERLFRALAVRTSNGALVRRLSTVGEVAAIAGVSEQIVAEVVEHFRQTGCNFLVATPPEPLTGKTMLDISHEALLRQWPTLRSWLESEARSAERYVRLADAALRWKANEAELLQGRELEVLLDWKDEWNPTATWAERYQRGAYDTAMEYLETSRDFRDRQLAHNEIERRWRPLGFVIAALSISVFLWGIQEGWFKEFQEISRRAEMARGFQTQSAKGESGDDSRLIAEREAEVRKEEEAAEKFAGAPKDGQEAFQWYRNAAAQGDASVLCILGVIYASGRGVPADEKKALECYRKAAEKNHANAQYLLGYRTLHGFGVPKNPEEGVKWIQRAAEQGNARGENALGTCYMNGTGVRSDPVEGIRWVRRAAERGFPRAHGNLALYYETGRGVSKNEAEAEKCYRKAAELGDSRARLWVIRTIVDRVAKGTAPRKDLAEAERLLSEAAERGDTGAQRVLGEAYLGLSNRLGVEPDSARGLAWFRKAADQGDPKAMHTLARIFSEGIGGIKKDEGEALKWQVAADIRTDSAIQKFVKTVALFGMALLKFSGAAGCYLLLAYSGKRAFRRAVFAPTLRKIEFAGSKAGKEEKMRAERSRAAWALNTVYAGFWRRAGAHMIDLTVFCGLAATGFFTIIAIDRLLGDVMSGEIGFTLVVGLILSFDWLYQTLMIRSRWQGTLGMMTMGLFVTDLKGGGLTFGGATKRHASKLLSYLTFGAGFFIPYFRPLRQTLHDRISGSVVRVRPEVEKLGVRRIVLGVIVVLIGAGFIWWGALPFFGD